ncbi:hypothetical protein CHOTACABRAS_35 [Bacillus phage Chotacabras]|nr:hypothetical protein CHOTACABRAS_35 [Bacillus phage Chotacabras]UGO48851.1 hypothetical protein JARJAR_37 [Bacillus phage vB_BanH_JarJar]UGO50342.1 hypothetical protein RONSWANSON_36 [Bacillus phage vB_BanH_RonSwanson]
MNNTFVEFEVGQRVVTTKKIVNGLIEVEPLTEGVIVYHSNQVKATVWFRSLNGKTNKAIRNALQTDTSFHKNGALDGLSLEIKRDSLAHKIGYASDMYYIAVDKRALVDLPLFNGEGLPEIDTRWYNGNEKYKANVVRDIIEVIDDNFCEWVSDELEERLITTDEHENGEYPEDWTHVYTDESMDKYYEKKEEVELAFAKTTGLYTEFVGGVHFE